MRTKSTATQETFPLLVSYRRINGGKTTMSKLSGEHSTNGGNSRVSARLSKPLFRRLRSRAAKEGKTMSETIAMLCSIGLLDLDECDRFEPEVDPRPHAHH
jgi:hypothetical protein